MKRLAVSLSLLISLCLLLSTSAVAGSFAAPSYGGNVLYENGPVNGTVDAWNISAGSGYAVTNSFSLPTSSSVEDIEFWVWLFPGYNATSVQALITTSAFGGSTLFDQVLSLTPSQCSNNKYGYAVCLETATFKNLPLSAGNYWLQLQNANSVSNEGVYWDQNSGVGCHSAGCPSVAFDNIVGEIPSEAFAITGAPVPEPNGLMDMFGGGFLLLAGVLLRKLKVFHPPA